MTAKPVPTDPSTYPRRVLLTTLGLTPQVLTETIYALAMESRPTFRPTEIHVVTTSDGAAVAREALLEPGRAMLGALEDEYGLHGLRAALSEDRIHVIADENGRAYADIDSQAASSAAADLTTELIRWITADDATALHVSLAGGRKTMGFFGGYVLSLFGRSQDRLSHVLVSPPFETHREFFYPTLEPRELRDRTGKVVGDARNAVLRMADVPFIPMGDRLPKGLRENRMSFSDAVAAHRALFEPPELVIDYAELTAHCQGRPVKLPARELAFLGWMARRVQEYGTYAAQLDLTKTYDSDYHRETSEFLEEYRLCLPDDLSREENREALREASSEERRKYFTERKSHLKSALEAALWFLADRYIVKSSRGGPSGLDLPPEAIRFVGEEESE